MKTSASEPESPEPVHFSRSRSQSRPKMSRLRIPEKKHITSTKEGSFFVTVAPDVTLPWQDSVPAVFIFIVFFMCDI